MCKLSQAERQLECRVLPGLSLTGANKIWKRRQKGYKRAWVGRLEQGNWEDNAEEAKALRD